MVKVACSDCPRQAISAILAGAKLDYREATNSKGPLKSGPLASYKEGRKFLITTTNDLHHRYRHDVPSVSDPAGPFHRGEPVAILSVFQPVHRSGPL